MSVSFPFVIPDFIWPVSLKHNNTTNIWQRYDDACPISSLCKDTPYFTNNNNKIIDTERDRIPSLHSLHLLNSYGSFFALLTDLLSSSEITLLDFFNFHCHALSNCICLILIFKYYRALAQRAQIASLLFCTNPTTILYATSLGHNQLN